MILATASPFGVWSYALLFALLVLFPLMAVQNSRMRDVERVPRLAIYFSSCAVLWALALAAALVLAGEKAPLSSLGFDWRLGAGATAMWSAGLLAYSLGIAWGAQLSRQRFHIAVPPILARVLPETPRETLAFLAIVCPTAGITEEVLFRAFAITRLMPLTGEAWSAALLAAAAFAFGHAYQGTIGMISTALIGIGYSVSYLATGSLMPAIAAHMLHNAVSAFLFKFEPA